jgi:sucrose-6-phosphatase
MKPILLCSDLDRTLIPNGPQPESEQARPLLTKLARHPALRLAYVSGRDRKLVQQAISDYQLPNPDFIIGDVGTTLYRLADGSWLADSAWQHHLGADWNGLSREDLAGLVEDFGDQRLWLQPPEKQNTYKLSYFTDPDHDDGKRKKNLAALLKAQGISANLIWSRDEAEDLGLLDILPASANKLEAIRFLMRQEGMDESQTVFAGDSGNDLDALTSGLQAVLVKNASADVRREAIAGVEQKKQRDRLYLARGTVFTLNGNYAAGVVEGVSHFYPELLQWLETED